MAAQVQTVASATDVMKFFEMTTAEFAAQWRDLPVEYKNYFKAEVLNTAYVPAGWDKVN